MALPIVIIGTGASGIAAAKAIRKINSEVELILITNGDGYTYTKPKLSLICKNDFDEQSLNIKNKKEIETTLSCSVLSNVQVISINTEESYIALDNNQKIAFHSLVIASGATPKKSTASLTSTFFIHSYNCIEGYRKLLKRIKNAKSVAIVGAGVVGCEIAYDLSCKLEQVYLLCNKELILKNTAPKSISNEIEHRLSQRNVKVLKNCEDISYKKEKSTNEIHFSSNQEKKILPVDLVIETIGIKPNVRFIEGSHININNGVIVNNQLKTNIDNIYALGDCASYKGKTISNLQFINKCALIISENIFDKKSKLEENNYNLFIKVGLPIINQTFTI
ncbi:FAD-dependent oxidoreductase [Vibrio neptunius]|uniref:FAD-dependent oxidoreductase n=1 Tax=Vibrio neptunius TaxID=170651 RepID=A0ABS3A3H0_9VIBR|nr:FAD-dependent oxidoreductase [Vibrio neptunius]MBN3494198.1 FAD-dependent oxidoreductase [Vibrio neptunius]MBN3516602.1 FAD-dependent oxidoreductase [Vibrio neptunius]MBN3550911.1 FAD-dependent oxidoreductase [Vibrio neptunius]MBN3579040.1 FAD-dependent oxidoreductase [Vibrio neptunius]MCH9872704.1 FAD-dependent oxidoreductase [Vibrio neptunius]